MTIRWLRVAVLAAISLCSAFLPAVRAGESGFTENPYALDPGRACGPICLAFLVSYYGGNESYEDIVKLCPPGAGGTSLSQLQQAAEHLGYKTLAFRGSAATLTRLNYPAILHLENRGGRDHFVVWVRWDAATHEAVIFSPPKNLARWPLAKVAQRFSQRGLIICQAEELSLETALAPAGFDWRHAALILLAILGTAGFWLLFKTKRRVRSTKSGALTALGVMLLAPVLAGCSRTGTLEDPLQADKGEVLAGTEVRHTFEIPNVGQKAFKVLAVKKSCTCQVVDLDMDREIPPGEVLAATVKVSMGGAEGALVSRVTLTTDSDLPELQVIPLSLRATVVAKVKIVPARLELGTIQSGQKLVRQVRVDSVIPGLLDRYRKSETDTPSLTVELTERRTGTLVFAAVVHEGVPPGDIFGTVTFFFDDPEFPRLEAKVIGRKLGRVKAIPSRITISASRDAVPVEARMQLQSVDGIPFRIVDVQSPEGIVAEWDQSPSRTDRETHAIRFRVPTDRVSKVGVKYIVIRTTRDECRVLTIPVVGEEM